MIENNTIPYEIIVPKHNKKRKLLNKINFYFLVWMISANNFLALRSLILMLFSGSSI